MMRLDITMTNVPIERVLEVTENPRHRYLLQAYYRHRYLEEMIWPYDERGRLIGEDVWEVDSSKAEIIKLDPADVITPQEAAEKLDPLIKPLLAFDEAVLSTSQG